jgi:hypothetical protein
LDASTTPIVVAAPTIAAIIMSTPIGCWHEQNRPPAARSGTAGQRAAHEPSANPTPRDAPSQISRTVARAGEALGRPVTADAAAILIRHADVVPADGALFSDLPGQTGGTDER